MKKGQKLNLAEFHSTGSGSLTPALPTGSSGRQATEAVDRSSTALRWDKQRYDSERGLHNEHNERSERGSRTSFTRPESREFTAQREREDEQPSRAEEATQWRSTKQQQQSSSRYSQASSRCGENESGSIGRAESAQVWRREAGVEVTSRSADAEAEWRNYRRPEQQERYSARRVTEEIAERDGETSRFSRSESSSRFPRSESGRFSDRSGRFVSDRDERYGSNSYNRGDRGRYTRESRADDRPSHLKQFRKQNAGVENQPPEPVNIRFARPSSPSMESNKQSISTQRNAYEMPNSHKQHAVDTRPEHLKIKVGKKAGTTETTTTTPAAGVKRQFELTEERYDETLSKPLTAATQKLSALQQAAQDRTTINDQQLADSFETLNLAEENESDIADVLAKSLLECKMSVAALVKQLQNRAKQFAEESSCLLLFILTLIQTKRSSRELQQLIKKEELNDVLSLLSTDAAKQKEILNQHKLTVLIPVVDLTADVKQMLEANKAPADILQHINSKVEAKLPVHNLAPLVIQHLMNAVYANKSKPNVDSITSFTDLLKRVLGNDQHMQVQVTADIVNTWFKNAAVKGTVKQLLQKLHSEQVLSAESLIAWRDDTATKSAGKQKALLQLHSWLLEVAQTIKAKEAEEESEGDSGDSPDEQEEDY